MCECYIRYMSVCVREREKERACKREREYKADSLCV